MPYRFYSEFYVKDPAITLSALKCDQTIPKIDLIGSPVARR